MNEFKRFILVLLLGLVAIFFQGTFLRSFLPVFLVPDFVLILVVFLGFYTVKLSSLFLVFLLGIQHDLASGQLIGPWSGAYVVVFLILALMAQRIFVESVVSIVVSVFVATIVCDLVYFVLIYRLEPAVFQAVGYSVIGGVVNVVCAPVIFSILRRLLVGRERRFGAIR